MRIFLFLRCRVIDNIFQIYNHSTDRLYCLCTLRTFVPSQVTDYAVLAQSGFTKEGAVAAQLWTCFTGILGSVVGVYFEQSFSCGVSSDLTITITG